MPKILRVAPPAKTKIMCWLFVDGHEVADPYSGKLGFTSIKAARTQALAMGPGKKFRIHVEGQDTISGTTWGGVLARNVAYLGTKRHPVAPKIYIQSSGDRIMEDSSPGRMNPGFDAPTAAKLSNARVSSAPGSISLIRDVIVRKGKSGARHIGRAIPADFRTLVVKGEVVGARPQEERPQGYGILASDLHAKMIAEQDNIQVHERVQAEIARHGGVALDALIAMQRAKLVLAHHVTKSDEPLRTSKYKDHKK